MREETIEKSILDEVDELIRSGNLSKARLLLQGSKKKHFEREDLPRFASLCRRAALFELAVLSLRPFVRPSDRKKIDATAAEKAEYASALTELGASSEAITLLKEVNPKEYPQVLLYTGFALFTRWEYIAAIPILEQYLELPELTLPQKIVGEANLASALLFAKDPKSYPVIMRLLEDTRAAKYSIAEGYAEMLRAESLLYASKYNESKMALNAAQIIFNDPNSIESLIVKKWRAIVHLYENPKIGSLELDNVRREAHEKKDWETVRHCDYYQAILLKDRSLYLKLFFGTPYDAFRVKLTAEFGGTVPVPECYQWDKNNLQAKGSVKEIHFLENKKELKIGQAIYRTLRVLASDFYRPFRIAELHAEIYPDQFYNPKSSVLKLHQILFRARKWIKKEKLPIIITEENATYQINCTGNTLMVVPHSGLPKEKPNLLVLQLDKIFSQNAFSLKEAQTALQLENRWATQRLLLNGIKEGVIEKFGSGTLTKYRLIKQVETYSQAA